MNYWKLSTFVLGSALAITVSTGAINSALAEPQPKMQAALKQLEDAKKSLDEANADKGGHRVKAMALVKDAIEETKKGIEFDNKK